MTEGFLRGRALNQVLKEMMVVKDTEEFRRRRKNSYTLTNFKILLSFNLQTKFIEFFFSIALKRFLKYSN